MTWVKLDDNFGDHPKIASLAPRTFRLHVRALCFAARHLTDGYISARQAAELWQGGAGENGDGMDTAGRRQGHSNQHGSVTASVRELLAVKLWERQPDGLDGYQIHDYLRYNPSREHVVSQREAARDRMAKLRSSPEVQANVRANTAPRSLSPARPVPNNKDSAPHARSREHTSQPTPVREIIAGRRLRLDTSGTADRLVPDTDPPPQPPNDGPDLPW
jgi:hypothetical protein